MMTILPRVFIFKQDGKDLRLDDPDQDLYPDDVQMFYANTYEILANAKIVGPVVKDDTAEYRFEPTMGTKG